ncbi:unnamed protein product [Sphagnum troendelagicum]|uniref:Uncharacterized protein n=1 Tax=Sphagnum troendelagicum TaxID=128251 RepID=A0ABP0TNN0_9BRYO
MSSFKLSPVVITIVFGFVALMSMQLITASSVEDAAHTNENHRKLTKSRFLVSNSMEGGSRRKLLTCGLIFSCSAGQTCCPGILPPITDTCQSLSTNSLNCGACGNICPLSALKCCSGKCVNTLSDSKNCGVCGHVCTDVPCNLGLCNYGL